MEIATIVFLSMFIWIALAVAVGRAASGRGQSGPGLYLLALLTSPLVAGLLLVLLTPPRNFDRYG